MSKGMILLDMPERCVDCSLATIPASTGIIRCMAVKKDCDAADKPEWCPIRSMPERRYPYYANDYDEGYVNGWNAVIKKLEENK